MGDLFDGDSLKDVGRRGKSGLTREQPDKFPFEAFQASVRSDDPRILSLRSSWQFYNLVDIQSEGDIASDNVTASLTGYASKATGYLVRHRWTDGDGSNTYTFTNVSGVTFDGIAPTEYVGAGTGYLDLLHRGSGAYEVVNSGEVWDNDAGNFTDGTFDKFLDGRLLMQTYNTETVDMNNLSIGWYRGQGATLNFPIARISTADDELIIMSTSILGPLAQLFVSSATTYRVRYWRGNTSTGDSVSHVMHAISRWTASYPKK